MIDVASKLIAVPVPLFGSPVQMLSSGIRYQSTESVCPMAIISQGSHDLTAEELGVIIVSLRARAREAKVSSAHALFQKFAEDKWATLADVEDIISLMDARIDEIRQTIDVRRWCNIFGVSIRWIYERPRALNRGAIGFERIHIADLVALLIYFERLGYNVGPAPFVKILVPQTQKREFVTDEQLSILQYEVNRHKCAAVCLGNKGGQWEDMERREQFVTEAGYKAEMWISSSQVPLRLTVSAPKYRNRQPPKRERCAICGYEWMRGDPTSSASHRREHKKRLAYLNPKLLCRFATALDRADYLIEVKSYSPKWKHREIYLRALAFRREFHYDFVQWESAKGDDDPNVAGILFLNDENIIVGACSFRLRNDRKGKIWRALQWVWIAPNYRRSGVLSKEWPALRKRFGDFHVEGPVSNAMQAFLSKVGDERLMLLASAAPADG